MNVRHLHTESLQDREYVMFQVRFVVMGNVFPTETKMDRRFDLKGSSHGRTAGAKKDLPNVILKVSILLSC